MNYLLDTHTFIWFCENDRMLSKKAAKEISHLNDTCFLSIASLWEIAIKSRDNKLKLKVPFEKVSDFLFENSISILSIELNHLNSLLNLHLHHRDPFDRIIISQAMAQNLTVITKDSQFHLYPIKCIW